MPDLAGQAGGGDLPSRRGRADQPEPALGGAAAAAVRPRRGPPLRQHYHHMLRKKKIRRLLTCVSRSHAPAWAPPLVDALRRVPMGVRRSHTPPEAKAIVTDWRPVKPRERDAERRLKVRSHAERGNEKRRSLGMRTRGNNLPLLASHLWRGKRTRDAHRAHRSVHPPVSLRSPSTPPLSLSRKADFRVSGAGRCSRAHFDVL